MATAPAPQRLSFVHILICVIASIGFAFDIYELLMLPLIAAPALEALGNLKPGTPEYGHWVGILFFAPAFAGGLFGLLGGYLTDVLGRRRVLTWSILMYAFAAAAAGFAELFPKPKQRESVLGITQAFSSIGGLLVTGAYWLSGKYGEWLPAIYDNHEAWRYALISGVIPALPLALIRPFLPESPEWQRKKLAGTLSRPSLAELFQPKYLRTTVVTTIMFACSYGAAF